MDEELWRELCELGWPGIAISEQYGGQGLGADRARDPLRGARARRGARAVPAERDGRLVIEQGGSAEQRERWLPGLASGETIGALRHGGTAVPSW